MRRFEWPTALLLLATAGMAVGPRFIVPTLAPEYASAWWEPLQHSLLLLGLLGNFLLYGRHAGLIPWPALVAVFLLILSPVVTVWAPHELALGTRMLHALSAWLVLALPWLAVVPRLQPGSTRYYVGGLVSLALLSALLGLALHFGTEWRAWSAWNGTLYRLQGATRADYFAGLAFGGVVVAVHEWSRRRSTVMGIMATVNAILLIYSGSRTALIVLGAWFACYLAFSPSLRSRLSPRLVFAIGSVGLASLLHFPVMRTRMSGLRSGELDLSGREPIWASFFSHFQSRPWLGLGLGSAQPGVLHSMLPHNEFLRLLVEGGVVGSAMYLGSILLWTRRVRMRLHEEDRPYLVALMIAMPLYSLTDNPISACYIAPFLYLGTLISRDTTTQVLATND